MRVINDIYFSSSIHEKKKKKYIKKIMSRKRFFNIFIIILREDNLNLLELVDSKELFRLDRQDKTIYVVGLTKSKEEATGWIMEKLQSTFQHYHTIDKLTLQMELVK